MNQQSAALQYASYQWSVIPIRAHEKRPLIRWQEFQHRCASVDEINQWFQRWPNINIAVVTGSISGIVVLDVDPRHGGKNSLSNWQQQYGALPQTVEVVTGGGGRHLYFKHPGSPLHNRVGLAPGIDFRGDGGCIVVPPSIHPNGKVYHWLKGHGPEDTSMAKMPAWLLKMVSKK